MDISYLRDWVIVIAFVVSAICTIIFVILGLSLYTKFKSLRREIAEFGSATRTTWGEIAAVIKFFRGKRTG